MLVPDVDTAAVVAATFAQPGCNRASRLSNDAAGINDLFCLFMRGLHLETGQTTTMYKLSLFIKPDLNSQMFLEKGLFEWRGEGCGLLDTWCLNYC